MDSVVLDEEELVAKHRKEKKELQAEIQKLKKNVSKGDKKKKKEVTEEIAQLETNLKAKQEEELAALKSFDKDENEEAAVDSAPAPVSAEADKIGSENEEDEEKTGDDVQKKSKAQRRRDKKQTQGREREKRIQAGAVESLKGPRHREIVAVTKMLAGIGMSLHEIPADGNCLYNAIGHQLALRNTEVSCAELRKKTADYLRVHVDDFLPFLTHPGTGDMMTLDEFSAYCDKTAKSPVWGGQIELRALSEVLQVPIQVLQADVQPLLIGENNNSPPITVVYQRHAYRLGEHYNSVSPKTDSPECNAGEEEDAGAPPEDGGD